MTKKDKEVGVMVSIEDLRLLQSLTDRWFLTHANAQLEKIEQHGILDVVELEKIVSAVNTEPEVINNPPYELKISQLLINSIQEMAVETQKKLLALLRNLSVNPHPIQACKINGRRGLHRIFFDDCHLVYQVEENNPAVIVISLAKP